jgi:tetratricopeptide (TPR) repeat protein
LASVVALVRSALRFRAPCLALVFCSVDVRAQSQPQAPQPAIQEQSPGEARFRAGLDLFYQGKFAEAAEAFGESQRISPHPTKLLNLGDCQLELGKLATALGTYEEALRQVPLHPDPGKRQSVAAMAAERIEFLEPSVPTLRFKASPTPGAVLRVEGRPMPVGEALRFDPGLYQLEVSAPGYEAQLESVQLVESQRLEFALPALSPSSSPTSSSSASSPPASGSPAHASTLPPPAESSRFGLAPPMLMGAGALLGGLGTYFGLRALASGRRLEQRCSVTDESASCDRLENDWKSRADTATWLWLGAGLAAGAGITLYVLEPEPGASPPPQPAARLNAWVGLGAAGLTASGRF